MSWEFTRDMIAPQDQQALDAFEDRKQRCEAYHKFVKERPQPVASMLEIGVRCGYCARAMLEAAPKAQYVGIDKSVMWLGWTRHLIARFNPALIVADSEDILPCLADNRFNIVHVDGNHTYAGALYDIIRAQGLVSYGGVIIVDDAEAEPVGQAIRASGIRAAKSQVTVSLVKRTGQLSLAFEAKT